ncbi:transcription factor WhiB [Kribbella pratensis]|uniref:Transcriptional regulator WhiB n=1 Tax=Kribbella pratensis TaxID=2512112 RepID=A0A4R8CMP4_9ACTN|nr:transcription factor WhiB [Kribbella pratensis]
MKATQRWQHRAACAAEDPELFFPVGTTGPALLQIETAKQVCRRCEVVDVCLNWALRSGQDAGIWGGLDELERRTLRRSELPVRSSGDQVVPGPAFREGGWVAPEGDDHRNGRRIR